MNITLKNLGQQRTQATIIFDAAVAKQAEQEALKALGHTVELKGFRKGNVPDDLLREHIPADRLTEETVHKLLPQALKSLWEEHKLRPIVRPRVELNERDPLTVIITVVEQPIVKVKGGAKLRVPVKSTKELAKELEEMKKKGKEGEAPSQPENETEEQAAERERQWKAYQERQERERREKELFDSIATATVVELASELIDEEVRDIVESQVEQIKQFGMTMDDWLKRVGKTVEEFFHEVRPAAEKRLKLRFGITKLLEEMNIEVSEEDLHKSILAFMQGLPEEYRAQVAPLYEKGAQNYEQFRSQKLVDTLVERILERG